MNQGPFKKRDLRFMNVQKAVTKSAYAITKVTEQLLKLEKVKAKSTWLSRVQTHYPSGACKYKNVNAEKDFSEAHS